MIIVFATIYVIRNRIKETNGEILRKFRDVWNEDFISGFISHKKIIEEFIKSSFDQKVKLGQTFNFKSFPKKAYSLISWIVSTPLLNSINIYPKPFKFGPGP